MKLLEIDRTNFTTLWSIPELGIDNLTPLANAFYDYYGDDELIATTSLRFMRRWELYVKPIIMNIGYEIKRWKAIKDQTPTSSRNRNITTKDVYDTTTRYSSTDNNTVNNTDNIGFQGFSYANQNGQFRKDIANTTTNDNYSSNNTYNSTNNITNTDATSIVNLWEVKEWLDTHYTTTLQDYFNEIANIIFIKFW